MSDLKPYPEYKDSGVEWLGGIPVHWILARLKASIRNARNGVWGSEPEGSESDIRCVRVADFDRPKLGIHDNNVIFRSLAATERSGRVLEPGDLLIEKSGGGEKSPVGFVVQYQDPEPAVCSNFMARVQLLDGMDSSFWTYVHSANYSVRLTQRSIKQSTGIQNLDQASYLNEAAGFPPFEEQRVIASFLDHETAEIDAFIADQEELIRLLIERRSATITQAVTRGLDPDVPMKDSGVEWLGEVPMEWSVRRLKHRITRIESGKSVNAIDVAASEGELGVLKTSSVYSGRFDPEENKTVVREEVALVSCPVVAGTIIVSRMNTPDLVGAAGYVRESQPKLFLPDRLWQIHFTNEVEPKFVHYWTHTNGYRGQIRTACIGTSSSMQNISQADLRNFLLAHPRLDEQKIIADYLDRETAEIDATIADAKEAIVLSKERRAALISAAVTGKIDVRDHPAAKGAA